MATAIYNVRVTNYIDGGWFEFEIPVDVFDEDVEDYDTSDELGLYDEIRDHLEIDWDFDRWEDLPDEDS